MSTISNVLINVRVAGASAVKELGSINTSFALLNGTLALVAKNVAKTAMDFEREMRNVNSIAQLSEERFNKLSESVRQLGKDPTIKDGPVILAKGLYQLVSSGFEAEDALQKLAVASKAASAGLTNTEVSVTALSSLMNAYNKKTLKDSINFSDQLFRVVDKGVISFEQLASNLGSVNAVAASSGVAFKEVGASFIELTRAGISASEAETSIANLIRAIADPSADAKKYAQLLGVELGDVALQTKGLAGVMQDLSKATNGSLSIMSKLIPESRAAKAALTLAKDEAKGFARALDEMGTSAGSTDRALAQQSKSLAFQFDKLKASVENLKIEYGNLINESLANLLPYFKYFLDYIVNLDENTKRIIVQTGLWTAAIGATILALKGLVFVMTNLINFALKHPYLVGAAITFTAINDAVTYLKSSTNEWAKALGSVLEKLDLINLAKQGIEAKKAEIQAQQDENNLLKQKADNLKTIQELTQKELELKKQGKNLDSTEQRKLANSYAGLITFASTGEDKKRLRQLALDRMNEADKLEESENNLAKIQKANDDAKAKANEKRLKDAELKAEAQKKAEEEAERRRKEYENNRKQGLEEIVNLEKQLSLSIIQNSKNEYEYQRAVALQEYNDTLKDAERLQKLHINTTELRKKALENYQLVSKKINEDELKDRKEKAEKEKEDLKRISDDRKTFVTQLSNDIKKIGATEKEKAQIDLKTQIEDLNKTRDQIIDSMKNFKDASGKNKFSKSDIEKELNKLDGLIKTFATKQNKEINKIDFGSQYKKEIEDIEKDLNKLADNEDLLRGKKLDQEKAYYQKQKDIAEKALTEKDNLSKESIDYYTGIVNSSSEKITKTITQDQRLQREGLKQIQNSVKDLANEFGLFDSKVVDSISNLIDFKNSGLEASQSLIDASSELTNKGFSGLIEWSKDGGDLTGIKQFFDLAISQSQKMFDSFKDNMREIKNFNDFASMGTDITNDLANTFTGGLTGSIGKFFGQKSYSERKKEAINLKELQISIIKDKNTQIEASYNLEIQKVKESSDTKEMKSLKLQKLEQDYIKQKEDQYNQEKDLAEKLFNEKVSYALEINRLNHKLQEDENDASTNAILKAQDDLLELEATQKDQHLKELKRIEILKDLQSELNKIKENYFDDIGKLMSKYYDLELDNIKKNHSAEYDLIRLSENKIKDNQTKIDALNSELDRINAEFDKRLQDPNLSAEASRLFAQQRQALINANNGIDLNALVRTPVDEFERKIAAQKEQIDLEYSQTGNLEKRSEALKKLAVEQNVYWSELAKTLVKGTKEYDTYIKNANDGFREFKSSVKDSIEVQKQNTIQNSKLESQISSLTDENKKLQSTITQANLTVNKDIDSLTAKFKTSTGEWITDINKARQALQGISIDSQTAINSLNKIQAGNTKATTTNVNNITATSPSSTPAKKEALANFSDALPNETMSAYIARVTKEDALAQQKALSSSISSGYSSGSTITGTANFSNSTPTTNNQISTGGSITNATTTGWFDKGGSFGWINPLNWFADGGIGNGPESGYPAMLHGKELILNTTQADNMAYLLKMANTRPSISSNNNSPFIFSPTIQINGSNLSENQLKTVINNVLSEQQRKARNSYGAY